MNTLVDDFAKFYEKRPPINDIVKFCSSYFDVDLYEDTRKREVAWPRYITMAVIRCFGYSSTQIGTAFKRDHSSVLAGISSVKNQTQRIAQGKKTVGKDIPPDIHIFLLTQWGMRG